MEWETGSNLISNFRYGDDDDDDADDDDNDDGDGDDNVNGDDGDGDDNVNGDDDYDDDWHRLNSCIPWPLSEFVFHDTWVKSTVPCLIK